jgi:hypothetical protein
MLCTSSTTPSIVQKSCSNTCGTDACIDTPHTPSCSGSSCC